MFYQNLVILEQDNPQTDSKIKSYIEPQCAENCPKFTVLRAVRGPYVSRKHSLGPSLDRFDISIKLFDRYT
jgi:hypothetical protein